MKHTYNIYTYDVWGNEEDGFDVNDRFKLGTLELSDADVNSDSRLANRLKENGFVKETTTTSDLEIDGDKYTLYVNEASNGYPLFELVLIEK